MERVILNEAEVKVAIREYIERHYKSDNINPWGMMALYIDTDDEKRVSQAIAVFEQQPNEDM